jgi:hypothetical protein
MASARTRVVLIALPVLVLATLVTRHLANSAALGATGFSDDDYVSVQLFFDHCIRLHALPTEVAKCMPPAATVDRFVAPTSNGDSLLLERYTYHAWGIGRWPVQIYYDRGGGVNDFYAQDQWPSVHRARPVSAAEAERWRTSVPRP